MSEAGARRRAGRGRPAAEDRPGLAARKVAAKLLGAVIDARTPLDGLTDNEHGHPHYLALEPRDRALVRAILGAALRRRVTIEHAIAGRLERPLPGNAHALSHLLHVAAAQILFLDVPDSAAVDLAVSHAKSDPRTTRFAGLVNGLLRGISRGKQELLERCEGLLDAPAWFVERLTAAYGEDRARAILKAHRHEAPVDFSVKSDPEGWAQRLGGIVLPTGTVRVAAPDGPIPRLLGYGDGDWWIQDAAAALPAKLFRSPRGKRIADLCAAPGGKTAQLALAGASVTAIDLSASRMNRLRANLDRLGLDAETVVADLTEFSPAEAFDAVLLDAPCSSTGTVRRHPDVPWTKSPEDVSKLAALQRRLLDKAVTLVRPGGEIVFSNCSLDPQEGEELVAALLAGRSDVERDPIAPEEVAGAEAFIAADGSLRTTPDGLAVGSPAFSGLDGFYAVRLRRTA